MMLPGIVLDFGICLEITRLRRIGVIRIVVVLNCSPSSHFGAGFADRKHLQMPHQQEESRAFFIQFT